MFIQRLKVSLLAAVGVAAFSANLALAQDAAPAAAAEPSANTLDDLLKFVKQGQVTEGKENRAREQRFAKDKANQAAALQQAEAERARFLAARDRVQESRYMHNVSCADLLAIAGQMLDGELEYRKGNHEVAFAHLRRAIELEDGLPYDEPWGWMQPTRHALGALLLEQDRVEEAEAVIRDTMREEYAEMPGLEASIAKITATEAGGRVVDRCMQIHGGLGVAKDLPFERWFREMRIRRIGEGPSEVHRMVVARDLIGRRG